MDTATETPDAFKHHKNVKFGHCLTWFEGILVDALIFFADILYDG